MASTLFVVGLPTTATTGESAQLVVLFAGFSLFAVAVGPVLDWLVGYVAGWEFFDSKRNHGR